MRHAAAGVALMATFAIGCGNDGTPTVTVDEDNVVDVAIAAGEAAVQGALLPYVLFSLVDFAETPPDPATGGPSAGGAPSPCEGGSFEKLVTDSGATYTFSNCGVGVFQCYVDGVVEANEATIDEVDVFQLGSSDLAVDCFDVIYTFDQDLVTCPDSVEEYEDCAIAVGPFTGAYSDRTIRVPDLQLYGEPFEIAEAAAGEAVASGLGSFEFEPDSELEIDCLGLPSYGYIYFGGDPPGYGTVEFDDETCTAFEVCFYADDEAEGECDEVLYPGVMPPV